MSFILQLFHAPHVRTVSEAAKHVDKTLVASSNDQAKFSQFRDDIVLTYPDLSESDADGDDVRNIWPEGLPREWSDAIQVIAVKSTRVDGTLMQHLGHAAARAGLHVLDPQNGLLYRSDAVVMDMRGKESRLEIPTTPPEQVAVPLSLTEDEVRDHIIAALCHRWGKVGFAADKNHYFTQIGRVVGATEQRIRLSISIRDGEIMIGLEFFLFCPAVALVWQHALGDHVPENSVRASNPLYRQPAFRLSTNEFSGQPGKFAAAAGASNYVWAYSMADVDVWISDFNVWFAAEGLSAFDLMTTPAGLARFALTQLQMDRLYRRNELCIDEIFSRLVLVGMFDANRKEEWMKAFRDHQRRNPPMPGFKDGFKPSRNEVLEIFAAYLDSAAFISEAKRLHDI